MSARLRFSDNSVGGRPAPSRGWDGSFEVVLAVLVFVVAFVVLDTFVKLPVEMFYK